MRQERSAPPGSFSIAVALPCNSGSPVKRERNSSAPRSRGHIRALHFDVVQMRPASDSNSSNEGEPIKSTSCGDGQDFSGRRSN